MKPRFALNLSTEAASLLRRVPDGWQEVGSVRFDAPDLPEAMSRLRAEAGDLSGGEVATKVVIPNSQILFTVVQAPGPDRTSRRNQIREALDGLTPYAVKDLVYDFETAGDSVSLAVVARETLEEAEGFADQYGFNPVCFVAIPEAGQFPREPWFGIISAAQRRLPKGSKVERDDEPIRILMPEAAAVPAAAVAEAEDDIAPAEAEAPHDPAPDAEAEALHDPMPEAPHDPMPDAEAEALHHTSLDAEGALPDLPAEEEPEEPAGAEPHPLPDEPEEASTAQPEPLTDWAGPTDWPDEAEPDAIAVMREQEAGLSGLTPEESALALPEPEPVAPADPVVDLPPPDEAPAAPPLPEPEESFVPPPLVRAPERPVPHARDLPPFTPPAPPEAAVTRSDIPEAPYVELEDDEVPDMPPGAFASRRLAAEATQARPAARLTADPKPGRPAGRPAEPAATRLPGGRSALPRPPAPVAAEPRPAPVVTAPGIAGLRARKTAAPPRATPVPAEQPSGRPAPAAPFGGLGGTRPARGKPRFLGLILTLILLLALAGIAAWSSFYLASGDPEPEAALAVADGSAEVQDEPAIEDEMLADLQDPADAEPEPAATDEPPESGEPAAEAVPAYAAPEAAAAPAPAAAPPAVASGQTGRDAPAETPQDEIFLTAMDQAPPSLDAVALPPPPIAPDAAPGLPLPPPPFGVKYEFGEDGMIRPSPEGVLAPGEFLLIAGKPPILPPRRPGAEAPAAAAAPAAAPAPPDRPAPAPGSIFPGSAAATAAVPPSPPPAEAAQPPAPVADPALAGQRPRARPALPEQPEAAQQDAAVQEDGTPLRVSSLRPRARPSDPEAEAAVADAQAATLMMATGPAPRPDGAPAAVATSNGAISPLAISVSRKPEARPNDFSQAIEAAVAAVVQTPKTPAVVAAIAPVPKAPAAAAARVEPDEEDEPDVTAAPRIPTKANVAQKATYANAINLSKTNLIGVYGTPSSRYALVRQSNGRYVKVRVGDRIDGGVVAAISSNELRYRKGSRILSLSMPKG